MLSMRSLIFTLFISYCVFYFYITRSLFYLSIVLSSSLADERVEKLDHLFSCCGMFVFFIDSSAFLVFKLLIVCVSGFLVLLLFSLSILSWMMSSTLLMNSMVFRWLAWLEETSMLESWFRQKNALHCLVVDYFEFEFFVFGLGECVLQLLHSELEGGCVCAIGVVFCD